MAMWSVDLYANEGAYARALLTRRFILTISFDDHLAPTSGAAVFVVFNSFIHSFM